MDLANRCGRQGVGIDVLKMAGIVFSQLRCQSRANCIDLVGTDVRTQSF